MTDECISPLRQRMIEDMTVRNFGEKTQNDYIRRVKSFHDLPRPLAGHGDAGGSARFPVASGTESGVQPPTINGAVSALRFFFTVTLDRPDVARHLTFVAQPRKMPVVLSPEEVARFWRRRPASSTRRRSASPTARACACPRSPR